MSGAGSSPQIRKVCLVGAGTMGRQLAWSCLMNGIDVNLFDTAPGAADEAATAVVAWVREDTGADPSGQLTPHTTLEMACDDVDLAFESVPENLTLKRRVHAELDAVLPKAALQGSNASVLRCGDIASATGRPDRFFNANFAHPRSGGRLVEVMPNRQTTASTIDIVERWIRQMSLVPIVLSGEILGYVQNRIWRAIKREALYLADAGLATAAEIDRGFMLNYGLARGPFALMDAVGLQTVLKIEELYYADSGDDCDRPPKLLVDLVAAGRLGVATGSGFYTYPDPAFEQPGWLDNAPGPDGPPQLELKP